MEDLKELFHQTYEGEAKAALRLKAYAEKAREEGYIQIAKLFQVIAFSEEIHGIRAFKMLDGFQSTEKNLESSFHSETSVAAVAYQEFQKKALAQKKEREALIFSQAHDVEETHSRLYKSAMNNMLEGEEINYQVCEICGYVAEGQSPEVCPVCGAKKEKFTKF
jgi:rubrerythrin